LLGGCGQLCVCACVPEVSVYPLASVVERRAVISVGQLLGGCGQLLGGCGQLFVCACASGVCIPGPTRINRGEARSALGGSVVRRLLGGC
jgi:hypothetical protein